MAKSSFGHIRKHRNTGKYRVFWSENKKVKSKVVPTKEDATQLLAKLRMQQGHVDNSVTLVHYFNYVIEPSFKYLSKRTTYDYRYTWSKIRKLLGDRRISSLTRHDIQNTIDQFSSPKMQENIFKLLRKIFNSAIQDDIIIKNPCNRNIKRKKRIPKKKVLYNKDELKEVLSKVNGTEWALPVLLECICGLRHEEYCGLNKKDFTIKDDCAYIEICRAVTDVNGKKVLKDPKTTTSARTVLVTTMFLDYLTENTKNIRNKRTLEEYENPLVITKRWRKYCIRNDIKYIPFGNMRSVYATLCAEAGCVDSIVCKTMGHSGNNIKEKNYQAATLNALKFNADMLAEYINFKYTTPENIIDKRDNT